MEVRSVEAVRKVLGEKIREIVDGYSTYEYDRLGWMILYGEPYPFSRETWEKEIKGKQPFELLPKKPYQPSRGTEK